MITKHPDAKLLKYL